LTESNINDIEVTDKFIWVAGAGSGLNRIDPVTNSVKNYYFNPNDNNSLSHNNILDIQQDSQGMIWLATPEGVNKFDPATETFTRYTEADGLPTNLTVGIVEGDDGEMWIASQNGLSQMVSNKNLNKVTFINYNSSDGLGTDVVFTTRVNPCNGWTLLLWWRPWTHYIQ
jgi:ligand-binding sensor domain-containing protein